MTVTEATRARLWAHKTQSVIIYPVIEKTAPTYSYRRGNRKVVLQKAKIAIRVGNGVTLGKGYYEQNEELTDKINELYIYYYERAQ